MKQFRKFTMTKLNFVYLAEQVLELIIRHKEARIISIKINFIQKNDVIKINFILTMTYLIYIQKFIIEIIIGLTILTMLKF